MYFTIRKIGKIIIEYDVSSGIVIYITFDCYYVEIISVPNF